jgi:hypothetical protein
MLASRSRLPTGIGLGLNVRCAVRNGSQAHSSSTLQQKVKVIAHSPIGVDPTDAQTQFVTQGLDFVVQQATRERQRFVVISEPDALGGSPTGQAFGPAEISALKTLRANPPRR